MIKSLLLIAAVKQQRLLFNILICGVVFKIYIKIDEMKSLYISDIYIYNFVSVGVVVDRDVFKQFKINSISSPTAVNCGIVVAFFSSLTYHLSSK